MVKMGIGERGKERECISHNRVASAKMRWAIDRKQSNRIKTGAQRRKQERRQKAEEEWGQKQRQRQRQG
jgi:hypothetical protein